MNKSLLRQQAAHHACEFACWEGPPISLDGILLLFGGNKAKKYLPNIH